MKQPGKGCWKSYSLVTGSSSEGETDYHFITAPPDWTGMHGLGMKMPPGQCKKWETSWLLFREEINNFKNFLPWQKKGEFFFYSHFYESASYHPMAQTEKVYSNMTNLREKKTISTTQAEKMETETSHPDTD